LVRHAPATSATVIHATMTAIAVPSAS
jgi:hypothetical protein